MTDPRKLARQCFAVASSTTHEGERDAAIGRGEAICKKHGLDLDDFDIPGRVKAKAARRPKFDYSGLYEDRTTYHRWESEGDPRTRHSGYWGSTSSEEVMEAIRRMAESYDFAKFYRGPTTDYTTRRNNLLDAIRYMESLGGKITPSGVGSPYVILCGEQEYQATEAQIIELADTIRRKKAAE